AAGCRRVVEREGAAAVDVVREPQAPAAGPVDDGPLVDLEAGGVVRVAGGRAGAGQDEGAGADLGQLGLAGAGQGPAVEDVGDGVGDADAEVRAGDGAGAVGDDVAVAGQAADRIHAVAGEFEQAARADVDGGRVGDEAGVAAEDEADGLGAAGRRGQ